MSDFEYRPDDEQNNENEVSVYGTEGAGGGSGELSQNSMNESGRYRYSRDPHHGEKYGQSGYNYGAGTDSQNSYNYGRYSYIPDEPPQKRRNRGEKINRPWVLKVVLAALIFGLVGGAAFTGVNIAGRYLSPNNDKRIETTTASESDKTGDAPAGAGSGVTAQDVSAIVANVMPSVVSITGTFQVSGYFGFGTQESEGAGSGFIIADADDRLMIATNNHVVADSTSLTVGFADNTVADAKIVGTDSDADLAVLSVSKKDITKDTAKKIKVATLGSSDNLKVGEAVIAIGNALGYGQSVTTGVVSAKDREVSFTDGTMILLQTDAAINPGNSGGILINLKGQVIGINNAKLEDTSVEGMGYAIPISTAKTVLDDLMNAQDISKEDAAFLGIVGKTIDSTYSQALGIPSGIFVSKVVADSPAESAGISAGDVITEIDGNKLSTMKGLKEKISLKKAGTKVNVTLQRANQNGEYEEKTMKVTLGKAGDFEDEETETDGGASGQDNQKNQENGQGESNSNPYGYYYNNGRDGGYISPFDYFFHN